MKLGEDPSIIYLKFHGEMDAAERLNKEAFQLAMMTKFQEEIATE